MKKLINVSIFLILGLFIVPCSHAQEAVDTLQEVDETEVVDTSSVAGQEAVEPVVDTSAPVAAQEPVGDAAAEEVTSQVISQETTPQAVDTSNVQSSGKTKKLGLQGNEHKRSGWHKNDNDTSHKREMRNHEKYGKKDKSRMGHMSREADMKQREKHKQKRIEWRKKIKEAVEKADFDKVKQLIKDKPKRRHKGHKHGKGRRMRRKDGHMGKDKHDKKEEGKKYGTGDNHKKSMIDRKKGRGNHHRGYGYRRGSRHERGKFTRELMEAANKKDKAKITSVLDEMEKIHHKDYKTMKDNPVRQWFKDFRSAVDKKDMNKLGELLKNRPVLSTAIPEPKHTEVQQHMNKKFDDLQAAYAKNDINEVKKVLDSQREEWKKLHKYGHEKGEKNGIKTDK